MSSVISGYINYLFIVVMVLSLIFLSMELYTTMSQDVILYSEIIASANEKLKIVSIYDGTLTMIGIRNLAIKNVTLTEVIYVAENGTCYEEPLSLTLEPGGVYMTAKEGFFPAVAVVTMRENVFVAKTIEITELSEYWSVNLIGLQDITTRKILEINDKRVYTTSVTFEPVFVGFMYAASPSKTNYKYLPFTYLVDRIDEDEAEVVGSLGMYDSQIHVSASITIKYKPRKVTGFTRGILLYSDDLTIAVWDTDYPVEVSLCYGVLYRTILPPTVSMKLINPGELEKTRSFWFFGGRRAYVGTMIAKRLVLSANSPEELPAAVMSEESVLSVPAGSLGGALICRCITFYLPPTGKGNMFYIYTDPVDYEIIISFTYSTSWGEVTQRYGTGIYLSTYVRGINRDVGYVYEPQVRLTYDIRLLILYLLYARI